MIPVVDITGWDESGKRIARDFNAGGFADCINVLIPMACVFTIDPSQDDFATIDDVRKWVASKVRPAKGFELVEEGDFIYHRPIA